jgi:F-type H+-transporting ATPase subunit a
MEEHPFSWFSFLPFIGNQPNHVITAVFVLLILFVLSLYIRRSISRSPNPLVPAPRFSLPHLFEVVIEFILELMEGIIGPHSQKYLPLIGTLFIYIFTCNILGIIPGFLPPTDNINTNAAWSEIYPSVYWADHLVSSPDGFYRALQPLIPTLFLVSQAIWQYIW